MRILDYRQGTNLVDGKPLAGFFIGLLPQATVFYEWANFDYAPRHPQGPEPQTRYEGWAAFLEDVGKGLMYGLQVDGVFRPYAGNDLIIDDSRDSYKWGAARSPYSPETVPLLKELLRRKLIDEETRVFFGNWALADGVYEGTTGQILARNPNLLILYHGTSTYRLPKIAKKGLKPVKGSDRVWPRQRHTEAVFLTPSLSRAMYFTRETVKNDQKRLRRMGEDPRQVSHAILRCEVPASFSGFVPDDDWRQYPECDDPESWENSLRLFGQVGIRPSIPIHMLTPAPLQYRRGDKMFHLGVTQNAAFPA